MKVFATIALKKNSQQRSHKCTSELDNFLYVLYFYHNLLRVIITFSLTPHSDHELAMFLWIVIWNPVVSISSL